MACRPATPSVTDDRDDFRWQGICLSDFLFLISAIMEWLKSSCIRINDIGRALSWSIRQFWLGVTSNRPISLKISFHQAWYDMAGKIMGKGLIYTSAVKRYCDNVTLNSPQRLRRLVAVVSHSRILYNGFIWHLRLFRYRLRVGMIIRKS